MNEHRNVVLVGSMGSGKSAVGPKVARGLGFGFVDTDEVVARRAGKTIPEIFEAEGELGFRRREMEALGESAERGGLVIATGGGIVMREENREAIRRSGFVVWLDASEATLWKRISRSSDRPMLYTDNPRETVKGLLEQRVPLYKEVAHLRIDSTELSSDEVAYGVAESARVYFDSKRQNEVRG